MIRGRKKSYSVSYFSGGEKNPYCQASKKDKKLAVWNGSQGIGIDKALNYKVFS
jgi:hypothetical protein